MDDSRDVEEGRRVQLFDDWAAYYDRSVEAGGSFPLTGYRQVLDEIVRAAGVQRGMKVLDLGIGTGNLAGRFAGLDCELWGVDFSAEMLARAREKVPQAHLAQVDLLGTWPAALDRRFERIVSAYVLHEFDLPAKVALLQRLVVHHLTAGGRIVVGDVAFETSRAREEAHNRWAELWDEEEFYWAADEAADACEAAGLQLAYRQVSSCGGVFVIEGS
jgi:putative AdoMet-dependent methyltransferase